MDVKRKSYPALEACTYLNTAACGLISDTTLKAMQSFNTDFLHQGSKAAENWMMNEWESARKEVSAFVGAQVSETVLVPSFSFAYNALIESIGKKKVLVYENDYPSLLLPLQLKEFELYTFSGIDNFSFDYEAIERQIEQENIEFLVISHVQYRTGYKADLDRLGQLCASKKIHLIVDATQSAGAVEINFKNSKIDALIWSNYKWINGGLGTGSMCVKTDFLHKFEPKIGGYGSYEFEEGALVYRPSIKSFQPSHPNVAGYEAMRNAIREKAQLGIKSIEKYNSDLLQYLLDALQHKKSTIIGDYSAKSRAGYFCMPYEAEQFEVLKQNNIVVTFREGSIRVGVHFYNTKEDVDRFLEFV
jgi:cysteine desulfurase/selenocysteine lyase